MIQWPGTPKKIEFFHWYSQNHQWVYIDYPYTKWIFFLTSVTTIPGINFGRLLSAKSGDFLTNNTSSPSIPGIHFGFSYKSGSLDFLPKLFPGWWFGTFFFPYIENVIIPIDELIFFREVGLKATNQSFIQCFGNPTTSSRRYFQIESDPLWFVVVSWRCSAWTHCNHGHLFTQADANKFTKTPPDAEQPRSFVQCLSGTCQKNTPMAFQKFMGRSQNTSKNHENHRLNLYQQYQQYQQSTSLRETGFGRSQLLQRCPGLCWSPSTKSSRIAWVKRRKTCSKRWPRRPGHWEFQLENLGSAAKKEVCKKKHYDWIFPGKTTF